MNRQGGYNWILIISSIASYYVHIAPAFNYRASISS